MNGIAEEKNGALTVEIKDATASENKEEIKALGFGTHGLVIYDTQDNIKQKLDGHFLEEPEIRKAVGAALGEE